jgi:hypothetical protein
MRVRACVCVCVRVRAYVLGGVRCPRRPPPVAQVHNHTHILVTLVPGVGQGLTFHVVVAGQTSTSAPGARVSYSLPRLLAITPDVGDTAPQAPLEVELVGTDFGLLDPYADVSIEFGNAEDGTKVWLGVEGGGCGMCASLCGVGAGVRSFRAVHVVRTVSSVCVIVCCVG